MMKYLFVFLLILLPQIGWSQSEDSLQVSRKDKAGYTSELEQGIASLTSFLALQDDAVAETLLRFPGLDSLTVSWFDWKRK
ncbi:hypothetical protein [Robiginitalea aurantiaca]|uniref:Uncharacterized protein n=1 Tax=Robiginitalea aurantiaca TaxID=3056915 RepID=A0ABT7WFM7_9FLAO|nr:hypothetical protein [Robiginitalea aurantiaca]MDM9631708.1 hypothetical protein [Robiginitalea aurantiaca]